MQNIPYMILISFAVFIFADPVLAKTAGIHSLRGPAAYEEVKPVGEVISSTVGQVGDQVITSRDVMISYAIDKALLVSGVKVKKLDRSDWLAKEGSAEFDGHLNKLLREMAVHLEAISFSRSLEDAEVETATMQVRSRLRDWPEWKSWEVDDSELRQVIGQKQRVRSFLKAQIELTGVQISEEEIKEFYDKNRVKFGNLPLESFRKVIREHLSQILIEEKLKEWMENLKRKYKVRYLGRAR